MKKLVQANASPQLNYSREELIGLLDKHLKEKQIQPKTISGLARWKKTMRFHTQNQEITQSPD